MYTILVGRAVLHVSANMKNIKIKETVAVLEPYVHNTSREGGSPCFSKYEKY